jgi:hypothetical protein
MRGTQRVIFAAFVIGGVAFAGSAMAQGAGIDVGVGITLAPGQTGQSPGQVYNAARAADPTTALTPGQLYLQNRAVDPTTAQPPGHTFQNYGQSRR